MSNEMRAYEVPVRVVATGTVIVLAESAAAAKEKVEFDDIDTPGFWQNGEIVDWKQAGRVKRCE